MSQPQWTTFNSEQVVRGRHLARLGKDSYSQAKHYFSLIQNALVSGTSNSTKPLWSHNLLVADTMVEYFNFPKDGALAFT